MSYAEIDISVSFFVSPRYLFDIIVYVVYNFNGASVNPVMKEVCQLTGSERYSYMRNWFAEHCLRGMHAPDFLLSGSQKRQKKNLMKLKEKIAHRKREPIEIERRIDLEPVEFVKKYLSTNTPVVMVGAAKDWQCVREWTLRSLAARYSEEPIRLLKSGPGEEPTPGSGELITFGEVVRRMEVGERPYVRFSSLINQNPELIEEFDNKWFLKMRGTPPKSYGNYGLFMGGEGTATGLHSAMAPNLFVQVYGQRKWLIYPAVFASFFSPIVRASPFFYSQVDASDESMDSVAQHLPVYEAILDPGDILFNPAFFWHQVHNLSDSIGVGYRWTQLKQALQASWTQSLITLTATNPSVWSLRHQKDFPTVVDQKTKR